jgi:hypothetical protein
MKMTKKEILNQIADWNEKNLQLQIKKAKLEKEILMIDLKLNTIMTQYDSLCRSLLQE